MQTHGLISPKAAAGILLGLLTIFPGRLPAQKLVALDGFHKNEPQPHYRWEGKYQGGYSDLAALLDRLGAARKTIAERLSAHNLAGVDCLIIAAPDVPSRNPNPQYISGEEAQAVAGWVERGGILLLFGNDPGNSEFTHLNELASRFGFEFIESLHKDAAGGVKLTLKGPADHPAFAGGLKFYAVQVAPLRVTNPKAEVLLSDNGETIMALLPFGKGRVLALGDAWLYNEYIRTQDNYRIAENLFRWLLR